ncbi:UNVERIFIED_CONTAM: hypothetical protein GTU68_065075, partial [Idotea baltica]|nr:hypothetical protein [Idotea baltica]
ELQKTLDEIEAQAADPALWSDKDSAQLVLKRRAEVSEKLSVGKKLVQSVDDLEAFHQLSIEEKDLELAEDLVKQLVETEGLLRKVEMQRMLSGPFDHFSAILEINAGAGGVDAQDWAEILLRMYTRWAQARGFSCDLVDLNSCDEGGLKSAVLVIEGLNAYGLLRSERGVHRLVRISPFDSNSKRHTSFVSVAVSPDIKDDIDIDINEDEIRVDTYRASGAGGQHVNKTDSAVRITHLPTGIVVACQNLRSQHKNKERCMSLLKAKLHEIELQKKREEMASITGERRMIDFGSQIRNYVMQPYQLAKDVRTQVEVGDVQSVLDGAIDVFIEAYLLSEEFNQAT